MIWIVQRTAPIVANAFSTGLFSFMVTIPAAVGYIHIEDIDHYQPRFDTFFGWSQRSAIVEAKIT